MPLRRKTLLIIGLAIVSLLVVLYTTSRIILLDSFAELEEQHTRQNVERALSALADDLSTLDTMVFDWAAWDDTYAFIEDANEEYIQSNLVDETFTDPRLNFMLFINSSGQTVFGKGFDLQKEEEVPVPQGLQEHLTDNALLLRHPDTESSVEGIVLLPEGPVLIASRPILTSEEEGPIRGTLMMGRYLDAAEIERLAEITHLSLTVRRFDDPHMPLDFQAVRSSLSEEEPIFVRPLDKESIAGYVLLEDIYGEPGLVLRADMPREIYKQGQTSISYFVLSLLTVGLVFGVVFLWHLDKVVLSRLAHLSRSVSDIGASGDLSTRVEMTGRDELSSLAGAINGMLEKLARSGEALRREEQEIRLISDNVPALVSYVDMDGRYRFVNQRYEEWFGIPRTEIIGQHYRDVLGEATYERIKDRVEAALSGQRVCYEEALPYARGGARWVSADYVPDADDGGKVKGFFALVTDITARKRTEEELRQRNRELTNLLDVSQRLAGRLDLDELLDAIAHSIVDTLPAAEASSIWLYDEDRDRMVVRAWAGHDDEDISGLALSPDTSLVGLVYRSRQPHIIDDVASEPAFELLGRPVLDAVRSVLGVPLLVEGWPIGALFADSFSRSQAFDENDLRLLQSLASQAAIAIENARLYEETRQRATELSILYDVATAAAAFIRLDETLDRSMAALQEAMGPDDIAILLVEPETKELAIRAHTGFPGGPKLMRRPIGVGVPGWVVKTGQPALLADVRGDERYHACDPDTRSELCVPLQVGERIIGAINLESRQLAAFSEENLRLLSIMAGHLATVIENARLFEEIEERRMYLEGVLGAAPDAIVTLDARHRIVEWNSGAEKLFGYSREEVIGRDLDPLVTNPDVLEEATGFRQMVMGGEGLPPVETVRSRKDGSPVDVLLAASPILVGDELIGIVVVYTDITERVQAEKTLRRRAEELAALQATVLDITAPHDLPTLLQTIIERAALLLNAPGGGLYLCDPDRGEARCVVSYNTPRDYTGTVLKYGEGAAGTVAQTGEPLIIDDYRTWSRRAAVYEGEQPFTSVLSAPMIWQGRVTGVIHVLSDVESRRFTQADLELLTLFANHAAIAVENARLYEQAQREISERVRAEEVLRQRTAQLEALRRVGLEITTQLNLDALLCSIVSQAMELVGGGSGGLYLYRPERDVLEWAMAVGPNLAPIGITLQRGEGLSGTVWESGEPLIVDAYQQWEGRAAVYEDYPWTATVGVPVRWGDEFLGVLNVLADPPHTFSPADAELLSLFATQAAIAIKNARLYEAEQERLHIAETLRQASTVLSSTLELGEVLGLILQQLQQVIPYDSASVQRLRDRHLEIVACQGFEKPDKVMGLIFPLDPKFPNYRVVTAKAPLAIKDIVQAYPHFQDEAETYESGRIRSWLGVPLIMKDQVVGMIAVDRAEVRSYTAEEVQLAVAFANQAAMAVENARLYQEAQQELTERKRAEEALRKMSTEQQIILDSVPATIWYKDTENRFIRVNKAAAKSVGMPPEDIEGKSAHELFPDEADHYYEDDLEVMKSGEPKLGIVEQMQTSWGEKRWVRTDKVPYRDKQGNIAGVIVFAVDITERKRAEEELQQSYVRLQRALEGTVNVLVSAIEMRDPYTAGHQRRVTKLACAIAHEMGLPEEQIEGLRMAGLIHDIGKMNVPAEILSKPGPLSDLQYGLIKSHTLSGYEVLDGTVDFPWPVAQIVLQHHERMDGSGYPQGLSGDEIMLEARILSVADVVEAMASHRPYREPLGLDKALEEIAQNRGVLYDPRVVDVCLKLFTQKGFTFE